LSKSHKTSKNKKPSAAFIRRKVFFIYSAGFIPSNSTLFLILLQMYDSKKIKICQANQLIKDGLHFLMT